jgi:hypothetical protein
MPKKKTHTVAIAPTKTERTANGLRESMFAILDSVLSGDISPAQANAAARAGDQIIRTINTELAVREYAKNYPTDVDPITSEQLKLA